MLAKLRKDGEPSVQVPEEFKTKCVPFDSKELDPGSFGHAKGLLTICVPGAYFRSGTANKILEAKEKEREKETSKRSSKRARRYIISFSSIVHPSHRPISDVAPHFQ